MRKGSRAARSFRSVFWVFLLNLIAFTGVCAAQGCLIPDDAYSLPHFPQGPSISGVAYVFSNIPPGPERTQLEYAVTLWNDELELTCAELVFVPGPIGEDQRYIVFQNGSTGEDAPAIIESVSSNGITYSATITIETTWEFPSGQLYFDPEKEGYDTVFQKTGLHELGHALGLTHYRQRYQDPCVDQEPGTSVMNDGCGYNDYTEFIALDPTGCDMPRIYGIYPCPTPTPEPSPTPGTCNGVPDYGTYPSTGCATGFVANGGICTRSSAFINQCNQNGGYDDYACACLGGCGEGGGCSPIVIDVLADGFQLTSAQNGINFDLDNNGTLDMHAWTTADSDDAWLALDRNGNGLIDNGKELFGSVAPQMPTLNGAEGNGFRALALYDQSAYGGNEDGFITSSDTIFISLQLWRDSNHNGISEACELYTLSSSGIRRFDLDYRYSRRVDQYGNVFKYRSKVWNWGDSQIGRWAWDVYLVVAPQ